MHNHRAQNFDDQKLPPENAETSTAPVSSTSETSKTPKRFKVDNHKLPDKPKQQQPSTSGQLQNHLLPAPAPTETGITIIKQGAVGTETFNFSIPAGSKVQLILPGNMKFNITI
jgi:hypothetical protein